MLLFLKVISFVLGRLPLGFALAVGRLLGWLAYRLDRRHREIALENLKAAYASELSPGHAERIVREVFASLAMNLMEFMRIPWLRRGRLEGYVECEGIENFDRALARGRGVILLTAHFGNWELMGAYLGLTGYKLEIVVRELDSAVLEAFTVWVRTRCGNRIVPKGRSMRRLLKALSENAITGILLDQNVARSEGVFVDFFSRAACTNKGPAMLATRSRAAVVPAFIIREGRGHRIVIQEELKLVDTGDRERDTLENTARFTAAIERMVRAYPEQWFWIHRRWKTRPEPE